MVVEEGDGMALAWFQIRVHDREDARNVEQSTHKTVAVVPAPKYSMITS